MPNYTVTLTAAEETALLADMTSVDEWIKNVTKERARVSIESIIKKVVDHCLENGAAIPQTTEDMITYGQAVGLVVAATRDPVSVPPSAQQELQAQQGV